MYHKSKPPTFPVRPSQCTHQRRATPIEQVFELPGDPDNIAWPSWVLRPGTLVYRDDTRRWTVRDWELKTSYNNPRGLAKGDWLVLEGGELKAFSDSNFQKLFEPAPPSSVSLLRFVPEAVEHDEMALPKIGLPEDNERTLSCLLLTGQGCGATLEIVATWTHGQCVDAENWALHEYVSAADNPDVLQLPIPSHVADLPKVADNNVF